MFSSVNQAVSNTDFDFDAFIDMTQTAHITADCPPSPALSLHSSAVSTPNFDLACLARSSSPPPAAATTSPSSSSGFSQGDNAPPTPFLFGAVMTEKSSSVVDGNLVKPLLSFGDFGAAGAAAWLENSMLGQTEQPQQSGDEVMSLEEFLSAVDLGFLASVTAAVAVADATTSNEEQQQQQHQSALSGDNGLLFDSNVNQNVTDLDTNTLDTYALVMMDQIMFPDETTPRHHHHHLHHSHNHHNQKGAAGDYSNALKSDHLLRMLDTPTVTLEAFQSILDDPDVVRVTVEDADSTITTAATAANVNCTPPSLALPLPFSQTTPEHTPLDYEDQDPFSFLDEYLPTAATATTSTNNARARANSTSSSISSIPIQVPDLSQPRPVTRKRRTYKDRQLLEQVHIQLPAPGPPQSPVLSARRSPKRSASAKNHPVDEDDEDSAPCIMDPNEILTIEMCPVRREFCCPYKGCSFGCNRRYNLKIHYMTHLPLAPTTPKVVLAKVEMYSCFLCGKVMRRRFDMQRHRLGMHGVPVDVGDDGAGYDGVGVSEEEVKGARRRKRSRLEVN